MHPSDSGVFSYRDYACFDAAATRLLEQLDEQITGIFADRTLQMWAIPAMLSHDVLARCGYFESFPDQVLAVAALDDRRLRDVAETGEVRATSFTTKDRYLTPAACLHVYPMLGSRPPVDNTTITLRARVFRNEGSGNAPMVRLSDYTVREFVFVGDREYVRTSLEHAKDRALALATELGLPASIAPASDNFFPTRLNQAKARLQRGERRKHELLVPIAGHEVALASFNDHELHFSTAFGFANERQIMTGCAGFGLERWMATSLARVDAP